MILHTALQERRLNMYQSLNPRKNTPHISPWRASYGVSFVNILEKFDRYNGTALYVSISYSRGGRIGLRQPDNKQSLQWHYNDSDIVSNHQPHDCLLNRLFKAQIRENIKALRHWPLCGEFTGGRWIPRRKASNAENVSIWWRHHGAAGKSWHHEMSM